MEGTAAGRQEAGQMVAVGERVEDSAVVAACSAAVGGELACLRAQREALAAAAGTGMGGLEEVAVEAPMAEEKGAAKAAAKATAAAAAADAEAAAVGAVVVGAAAGVAEQEGETGEAGAREVVAMTARAMLAAGKVVGIPVVTPAVAATVVGSVEVATAERGATAGGEVGEKQASVARHSGSSGSGTERQ